MSKQGNAYADLLPYYDQIPKAVLASIAVSFSIQLGADVIQASDFIVGEWITLHKNGIVPQYPGTKVFGRMTKKEA